MDHPVFTITLDRVYRAIGKIDRHAAAKRAIVEKEALYHLATITKRDKKLFEAVVSVVLHDVPEDGTPADLDHGLGTQFGLLRQARALSAGQNHDFHAGPPGPPCEGV